MDAFVGADYSALPSSASWRAALMSAISIVGSVSARAPVGQDRSCGGLGEAGDTSTAAPNSNSEASAAGTTMTVVPAGRFSITFAMPQGYRALGGISVAARSRRHDARPRLPVIRSLTSFWLWEVKELLQRAAHLALARLDERTLLGQRSDVVGDVRESCLGVTEHLAHLG